MNIEQNKKMPDFVDKRSSAIKTKVSSYTQVEPEFVRTEVRSIVGQEDFENNYLSKTLQDLSLRKQNKGIRPPLVGQASSSSNDSVSIFHEGRSSDTEHLDQASERTNSPYQAGLAVELGDHVDVGLNGINFTRGNYTSTPFLLNRDEYINQRPPEGSSGKPGLIIQPLENSQDFQRMRSLSSASSVTSSKPLEWDSGADVGYNQLYAVNGENLDPGISTIERMALACGTNLLTRSDPEGTTGQIGQPQPTAYKNIIKTIKSKSKKKIGHPNAESTPVGTRVTSDVSPDTVSEDVISPINCENVVTNLDSNKSLSLTGSSPPKSVSPKEKIPLFPELIINSLPTTSYIESGEEVHKSRKPHLTNLRDQLTESDKENGLQNETNRPMLNFNTKIRSKLNSLENKALGSNSCNKKLSLSLENVSSLIQYENKKTNLNTLPRCQSQSNLNSDNLAIENFEGRHDNNVPKYSMAIHNLIQYNKSASSSSVATVVHRKGDSSKPLHSSNSAQQQESVGIQVFNYKDGNNHKSLNLERPKFNETPHLPKAVTQQLLKRSNYFNFDTLSEKQDFGNDSTKADELTTHSHDGIPCTGAHKKIPCLEKLGLNSKSSHKQSTQAQVSANNIQSNVNLSHRPVTQGFSNVNNIGQTKQLFGTGTIDSVESSAKSGGWTDKPYSVTVEDRVNSFEYLPGHIYENSERQPPIESRGTSSMSIQNQTSNNDTPEEESKIWDSSASTTSTCNLEKDVRRGVEIISDFVKGSCANDSLMKKKLIRRVVEKLITKNYDDDNKVEHVDLKSNVPWVPSRPPNPVERNGRETRRSLNRSKVPCEFSSRSEKSGSTNASSDCFIPRPAASSTFLPSSLRETNGLPGKVNHSSTSEISLEKSSKNHVKPPHPFEIKGQLMSNDSVSKLSDSSKASRSSNWKEPTTKTEKLCEERKKLCNDSSNSQSDAMTLVQYLNMERENQLFWIRSEIQHLSNLKELLEKQEELKRGLNGLKVNKNKSEKTILKDRNKDRTDFCKESTSTKSEAPRKASSLKKNKHQPTLCAWLEKSSIESRTNNVMLSVDSTETGMEDWTSHHYNDENEENPRSCMKRKTKSKIVNRDKRISSADQRERTSNDDKPPLMQSRYGRTDEVHKVKSYPATPYRPRDRNKMEESVFITDEGLTKKNAQTETLESVGVQTTDSVQQLPVVHPNWFTHKQSQRQLQPKCQCACSGGCRCCGDSHAINKTGREKKVPMGYYITFEPKPSDKGIPDNAESERGPLEEVRIAVPMSEPKQRPSRRLRAGGDIGEKVRLEVGSTERARGPTDVGASETEHSSSQSDKDNQRRPHSGKPTFQGNLGMLQYYLLRNRPSYVSRAEDRRQCIAQMQYLRELREHSKRRLLSLSEPSAPPQPPLATLSVPRVFSQQTMRRQTERKYRQLSEVRRHQQDTKRKESYRTNRLMSEIFNKKLQKRVLKGEVNLSNSVSVISSL